MFLIRSKDVLVNPEDALPGRTDPIFRGGQHAVLGVPMLPPFPESVHTVCFGMGCFWGAERRLWSQAGVYVTATGYAGGMTPNPTYEEVCSGLTGHAEVVLVVYEARTEVLDRLLRVFWESHDPTQGMRQGNDRGTQYRSAIYFSSDGQRIRVESTKESYQRAIKSAGFRNDITTEIKPLSRFYYAEDYHQQYLYHNPSGYCGLKGLGVDCD